MTKEIKMTLEPTVTKIFSKYLDQKISKKIKTIEDVLNLPISAYKFLNSEEVNLLEDVFKIKNISDATKINRKDPIDSIINFDIKEEENLKINYKILIKFPQTLIEM